MNTVIQLSLFTIGWTVALVKFREVRRSGRHKTDRIVLNIWFATLFFAITMTFLTDVFARYFDALTVNNLSRLIAYCSILLALYFIAITSLGTFRTTLNDRFLRLSKPFVVVTLLMLFIEYVFFISRLPQWKALHVPQSLGEAVFMFTLYSSSLVLCVIIFSVTIRYYQEESVTLTRYRLMAVILTGLTAAAFLLVKIILVLGYFWSPLSSVFMIRLSMFLLALSGLMWAGTFLNNRIYLRIIHFIKSVENWMIFKDLEHVLDRLDRLCPPIATPASKPLFKQFLQNSEYHLYRATVRILDGKVMLSDYLSIPEDYDYPDGWDMHMIEEARRIDKALKSVQPADDFWELVHDFRRISRELRENPLHLETAA